MVIRESTVLEIPLGFTFYLLEENDNFSEEKNECKSNLKSIFKYNPHLLTFLDCQITTTCNLRAACTGWFPGRPPGQFPRQFIINLMFESNEFISLQAHGKNFTNLAFSSLLLASPNPCWPRRLRTKYNLCPGFVTKNEEIYFDGGDKSKLPDPDNNLDKAEFSNPVFASTVPCWPPHSDANQVFYQQHAEKATIKCVDGLEQRQHITIHLSDG